MTRKLATAFLILGITLTGATATGCGHHKTKTKTVTKTKTKHHRADGPITVAGRNWQ